MTETEEKGEWESSVGKIILSFGDLELVMYRLYEIYIPDRSYYDDNFESRFNKLIGTIKLTNSKEKAVGALIELKKLSETRHLLAHSALYIDMYQHDTTGKIKLEMSITDKRLREKRITMTELKSIVKRTSKLVKVIYEEFQDELWRDEV